MRMADSAELQRSIEGCRKWPLRALRGAVPVNAERLLYPLASKKRPDRLRPPSGQLIIDQMLDLAHLIYRLASEIMAGRWFISVQEQKAIAAIRKSSACQPKVR